MSDGGTIKKPVVTTTPTTAPYVPGYKPPAGVTVAPAPTPAPVPVVAPKTPAPAPVMEPIHIVSFNPTTGITKWSDGSITKKTPIAAPATTPTTVTTPAKPVTAPSYSSPTPAPTPTPTSSYTSPAVTPVKTQAPPTGTVGVADTLRAQGYDVQWSKEKGVTVNGKPIDTSRFTLINDKYYGKPNDIMAVLQSSGIIPNNEIPPASNVIQPPATGLGEGVVSDGLGQGGAYNPTPAPQVGNPQFDELMNVLMGLINKPDQQPNYMSQHEARNLATNELNPEFNSAMSELNRLLNIDMEKRGIFNSPLASGIFTERNASLEAQRQAEIAKRTTGIISEDKEDANTAAQLALQSKNARMDSLGALLNTLSNRELSTAELTGVLNGVKTLAAQEFEENKRMNQIKTDISIGELTGVYNGISTLAGRDSEVRNWATQLNVAMDEVNTFGKVTTQATADALGVPVGTESYKAIEAAEERAFRWKTLMADIDATNARASLNSGGSGAVKSKTTLAQDLDMWEIMGVAPDTPNLQQYGVLPGTKWNPSKADSLVETTLAQDLAMWETTGKAPDTPHMKAYGVAAGTPWTQSAVDKLNNKLAENELQAIESDEAFIARVESTASQYKVSEDTAAAMLALFENPTRDSAFAKFESQKATLRSEGVDVNFLEKQLNSRFPAPANSKPIFDSTQYDPALINQNYGPSMGTVPTYAPRTKPLVR
jgi:hypothetical protein